MKKRVDSVTVGTDTEVFLRNTVTGDIITAEGIIKGTKGAPCKMDREGCATQLDNVSLEYNVPPVGIDGAEDMWENINYVINTVTMSLPEGIEIAVIPSATLKDEYLKSRIAKTMGCDISFNAWTRAENPRPSLKATPNLRCNGGHIHIGYENPDMMISEQIIRFLDLYLGVVSILLDTDVDRKRLYGKAGEFRFTDYGCEYRVISNFWTKNKDLVELVFTQIKKALQKINDGETIEAHSSLGLRIVECINAQNKEEARKLIAENKILEPSIIEKYAVVL